MRGEMRGNAWDREGRASREGVGRAGLTGGRRGVEEVAEGGHRKQGI